MFSTFAFAEAPFSYQGLPDPTISIVGVSGVSVSAYKILGGAAAITDTSSVSASAYIAKGGYASINPISTFTASAIKDIYGAAVVGAVSDITADGAFILSASASLAGTSYAFVIGGYKWSNIQDTSETWTTVSDQSEIWTTVTR